MRKNANNQRDFETRLAGALRDGELLCAKQRVVVAVSGGADSVALLHALTNLARREENGSHLIVAHLDHGLRTTSADDAAFVERVSAELGWECVMERADVSADAREQREGVEHAARMARYAFLARVAKEKRAATVATAHHADDNVETILFRILRGTSMRGLGGMEAKRRFRTRASQRSAASQSKSEDLSRRDYGLVLRSEAPIRRVGVRSGDAPNTESLISNPQSPIFLIRPFLTFRRAEILAYCEAAGLTWREDHTNDDTQYRRNFLRHELLPLVRERLNDKADEALLRLGEQAGQAEAYLTQQAEDRLARAESYEDDDRILIDVTMFAPDPTNETETILRTTAYRLLLGRLGMGERNLTAEHLRQIDHLLRRPKGTVNLPDGFSARRERNQLIFLVQ